MTVPAFSSISIILQQDHLISRKRKAIHEEKQILVYLSELRLG